MLILPWDASLDAAEWQGWVATTERFGVLAVNNLDPAQAPLVVPTHFTVAGEELLLHLARPNPIWAHLEAAREVRLAMTGDYAYVPSYWRPKPDVPEESAAPTSYYVAVQFVCRPTVVDDPQGKADIISAQLADLQPEGRHGQMSAVDPPYARMLPGIRGIRLAVLRVDAKFKFDDEKPVAHRERVSGLLDQRGHGLDARAAVQQRRRTAAIGEWRGSTEVG